jgi:hypothetical protein
MNTPLTTLSLTGDQHALLMGHLYPGDNKEAVAILLCNRRTGDRRHRLVAREIHLIPHEQCSVRTETQVTWPTDLLEPILDRATKYALSVIKIHSHPGGYPRFSQTDDIADRDLLPLVRGWVEADVIHGSVVTLPNGEMFGRVLGSENDFIKLDLINVVGDDLYFWYSDANTSEMPSFVASHAQLFGAGTTERFRRLSIAVIGCSGTGSPVIEQLIRLGVGELVIVDDDRMDDRNVNRILNSTMLDANEHSLKALMLAQAIDKIGLGTRVIPICRNLWDPEVIRQVAQCDIVFGCMDTVDGRFLLNTLATYYTLAYFDLGVRLDAVPNGPQKGKIREVCGTVHYLQPGRSSLISRGLFTMEQVAHAHLRHTDPAAHQQQVKDGYIKGVQEYRPAVISVNMYIAALAVNDFLARLHPYREAPNCKIASIEVSLSSLELFPEPEGTPCTVLQQYVGKGDVTPLLDIVELS